MKCLLIAVLLAGSWMSLAHAESVSPSKIVKEISRAAVLQSRFTQTKTIAALTRPLVTSGRFTYARDRGVLWRIEKPYQANFLLNEEGVREFNADGQPRDSGVPAPGMQHVSRIFRALFEPDIAMLEQYFASTASGDPKRWTLLLEPRAALRQVFTKVSVSGSRFVENVRLDEANGDITVIHFDATKESASLTDDEQRFFSRP